MVFSSAVITAQPYQVHRPFGLEFLGLYACYSANDTGAGDFGGYWYQFVSTTVGLRVEMAPSLLGRVSSRGLGQNLRRPCNVASASIVEGVSGRRGSGRFLRSGEAGNGISAAATLVAAAGLAGLVLCAKRENIGSIWRTHRVDVTGGVTGTVLSPSPPFHPPLEFVFGGILCGWALSCVLRRQRKGLTSAACAAEMASAPLVDVGFGFRHSFA